MKNVMRILSLIVVIVMFGYTMKVQSELNKQLLRIDRNVQELVSDVYKRNEGAQHLSISNAYEVEKY